jgi:phosphoribosyl 1,2-cyclic phosphate phosphodiesterase
MRIEILGSGGAISTPRPGCTCHVCVEAREKGIPYSRSGPAVFVHDAALLIDTPEEIKYQLNRSRIPRVNACVYSHWHPDHTMGRRVWEMNQDFRGWPPAHRSTDIYLPQQVAVDFRRWLGLHEHFGFLERQQLVRMIELHDDSEVTIDSTTLRPIRLAEDYVYAFHLESEGTRVLIAPDELHGWHPGNALRGLELAVLPMGVVEHDPFTGERKIAVDHPVLRHEATFAQTLEIVRTLGARSTILTHIEEPDGLTFDDLLRLERKLEHDGFHIRFAYDTMIVEV